MKEFDHPHVTKLIGKPAVLLTPAPSPPSLTCPPGLLSESSIGAGTSVL